MTPCISSFTNYLTIEKYYDSYFKCSEEELEKTLVSIDVAHFIKNWADFKTFYLACIGQLILSPTLQAAEDLIEKLFVISLADTDGYIVN